MRQSHKITFLPGKCRMTQLARRRLDTMHTQRSYVHMLDAQRNTILCTEHGAKLRPCIGVWADAVMYMQSGKSPGKTRCKLAQKVQQHHRIHPTAQTNQDGTMRREQRYDARRYSLGEI